MTLRAVVSSRYHTKFISISAFLLCNSCRSTDSLKMQHIRKHQNSSGRTYPPSGSGALPEIIDDTEKRSPSSAGTASVAGCNSPIFLSSKSQFPGLPHHGAARLRCTALFVLLHTKPIRPASVYGSTSSLEKYLNKGAAEQCDKVQPRLACLGRIPPKTVKPTVHFHE